MGEKKEKVYIYICVCVCVYVEGGRRRRLLSSSLDRLVFVLPLLVLPLFFFLSFPSVSSIQLFRAGYRACQGI